MADTGANRRGQWHGRRWSVAGLALSLASCADLLDLPSDPRLEQPAAQPEVEPARGGASRSPSTVTEPPLSVGPREDVAVAGAPPSPEADAAGELEATPDAASEPVAGGDEPPAPDAGEPGAPEAPGGAPESEAPEEDGQPEQDEPGAVEEPPPPASGCVAPELVGPNGRCFLVVTETLAWEDARASCQARGEDWDLSAIRDAAVNDFVGTLTDEEAWLGASDAAAEGTWRWVSDGQAFWSGDGTTGSAVGGAFEAWNSNEPNGRGNSDCARTVPIVRTGEGLTWADLECFELRASLCEGPPL